MGHCNKYRTKQLHGTHRRWWLVYIDGWVATKENRPTVKRHMERKQDVYNIKNITIIITVIIIIILIFFNCPWYSIPKGEEIKKIVIKN